MNDKRPLVTSTDCGKNEDSVVSLLKKLDGLELDLEGYSGTLQALATTASNLSDPSNPLMKDVQQRQVRRQFQSIFVMEVTIYTFYTVDILKRMNICFVNN